MAKTIHSKIHRIRHRGRLLDVRNHMRTLVAHLTEAATQMNAIGGVAGVTNQECLDSIEANATINPVGVRDIRARDQMGVTTIAGVEALGIPIA